MEMESCIPLGFRFHPTEEELVGYYLQKKINSLQIDLNVIVDIDLYQMEPWEIQDKCKMGYEDQNEWYFFSHKDKKYPTGTRTNRATTAGFWKATGRDKAVLSKDTVIGMRKTLVFYKGRAPNGRKTDWIMHEYRLQTSQLAPPQEEGWVVCRAFKKPCPSHQRQGFEVWNVHASYSDNKNSSSNDASQSYSTPTPMAASHQPIELEQIFGSDYHLGDQLVELPKLDSPSLPTSFAVIENFEPRKDWDDTITNEDCDGARSNNKYIDHRQNLGQQLAWRPGDSTSLMSQLSTDFCDLSAQNHATHGHLMGCCPDDLFD